VNSDERLAAVVTVLEAAGLTCLVMGGHAVRFYGLHRYTSDFDLHLSADGWDDLAERLNRSPLATGGPLPEGPSWRPHAFRRFQIGRLDDGREEWLEFWRENHLLDAFPALHARREEGEYGGRVLPFLGLADLIRSKETERESDWDDVLVLEEFLDARSFAALGSGRATAAAVLNSVRSRRGFERVHQAGLLNDTDAVRNAIARVGHPVSWCYLAPSAPGAPDPPAAFEIEPVVVARLRTASPASPLHLSLVEIARRRYKARCQAADAANKQAIRALSAGGGTTDAPE
jgi:hypothetical protein